MIVFDASSLIGAAFKADSVPARALLRAEEADVFALSTAVDAEIAEEFARSKFVRAIPGERIARIMDIIRRTAVWFEPVTRVNDCRDAKDNKYLELASAAGADIIVSSDGDLLVLHP